MNNMTIETIVYTQRPKDYVNLTLPREEYEYLLLCREKVEAQRKKSLDCYYKRTGRQRREKSGLHSYIN